MTTNDDPAIYRNAKRIFEANNAARRLTDLMSIWTVYNHPKDYPDTFVARRFEIGRGIERPRPTTDVLTGDLDIIRRSMQACGLYCMPREDADDPNIVESWL